MGTIEEIIKTIDDKLIETGKRYLLLGQANQLLESLGIISFAEKSNKTLKKLLEENKIPHAYQTENAPRQWRIPLSENGKQSKKNVKKNTKRKLNSTYTNTNQSQTQNKKYTRCPNCFNHQLIPQNVINATYIQCCCCGKNFKNPLLNNPNSINFNITKTQRNWIIAIIVIVIFFIIGNLGENDSSSSSNLYFVNTTTYTATSKTNFDEMYRYINDRDEQALSSLMLSGQMKTLSTGTEVNLVSSHFSYCIVRQRGSTQNLWIATGHITQK